MGASDFSNLPHIGEALRRKEDYRFLTGAGNYTDDITLANQSHAVFVRSPHAHAAIKSVDIAEALKMPGVVGIFSGKDIEGKMGGLPCGWLINNPDGTPMKEPMHPILAINKVRYVGDHVAMVVAETVEQAKNAAEAVVVDYDVLPAVVSVPTRRRKPAASPCTTKRPTTSATNGRWATRRRSMGCLPRPRMSPSSIWSTTG
jgi:carbon-monoxide dehydrogenase large subunit